MTPLSPPKTLRAESRYLWLRLNKDWEFDHQSLIVLKTALEAYDRLKEAREQVDREGITTTTPSGLVKPHPALRIEKEARGGFLQAWRILNLSIEPPGEIGRPTG